MTNPISQCDVADRQAFIGLDASAIVALTKIASLIDASLPSALARFEGQISRIPVSNRLSSAAVHDDGPRQSVKKDWDFLTTGKFDAAFVEVKRHSAQSDTQADLDPRWYIGALGAIVDELIHGVTQRYFDEHMPRRAGVWPTRASKPTTMADDLANGLSALVKCILLDVDLAVAAHLHRLNEGSNARARQVAAETELAARVCGEGLRNLACGDLSGRVTAEVQGRFSQIKEETNVVAERFSQLMRQLQTVTGRLLTVADDAAGDANQLSFISAHQASSIDKATTNLEQVVQAADRNVIDAEHASAFADRAVTSSARGADFINDMEAVIGKITDGADKISSIIGMIDDIAFQTGLLAQKASAEATGSGEKGKAYASVAEDVRQLAETASYASRDIKRVLDVTLRAIGDGERLAARAPGLRCELTIVASESAKRVGTISDASTTQSRWLRDIVIAVRQIGKAVPDVITLVERTNLAAAMAQGQVAELDNILGQFRLAANRTPGGGLRLVC